MKRRPITDREELHDLDCKLLEGLIIYMKRNHIYVHEEKAGSYDINDLARDLDAAIAKAQAAFVHSDRIVDLLENHIAAIARRQAAAYSSAPAFVSGNL